MDITVARTPKTAAPFPSTDQILAYIQGNPSQAGKREIARSFKLNTDQKKVLKKVLREMEETGVLEKKPGG